MATTNRYPVVFFFSKVFVLANYMVLIKDSIAQCVGKIMVHVAAKDTM